MRVEENKKKNKQKKKEIMSKYKATGVYENKKKKQKNKTYDGLFPITRE